MFKTAETYGAPCNYSLNLPMVHYDFPLTLFDREHSSRGPRNRFDDDDVRTFLKKSM